MVAVGEVEMMVMRLAVVTGVQAMVVAVAVEVGVGEVPEQSPPR